MPTLRLNFGTPDKAKHFADNFGVVGIQAEVIQEDRSVIVRTADSKSASFVKQMAQDIQEESKAEKYVSLFLQQVKASAVADRQIELKLLDGSTVHMESTFARRFLMLHEKLGEEARRNMCLVTTESKASYAKAVSFVMDKQG
jgi:hypothetical protein